MKHTAAIFRQVNKQRVAAHHDALEFADGQIVPKTVDEREKQKRATYVG
jgi:hypothetical protein